MKVSSDSRTIQKGEYFVPFKGDNFDGHKFINDALEKGASGVIEEEELYEIAKNKLTAVKPFIIGIAGSVGKTTFREYLSSILSTKYKVFIGDLNTKLGLATRIVNDLNDEKILVAEIGIDRVGEMEKTLELIKPDIGIITKLEKEHLEFLNNIETVTKENFNIIRYSNKKTGFVNIQDKALIERVIKSNENLYLNYFPDKNIPTLISMHINEVLTANHNKAYLKAIYQITKTYFNFNDEEFIKSLNSLKSPKGRLNIIKFNKNVVIIDDSYNAVCDQSVIKGLEFAIEYAKNNNLSLEIILSPMRETGQTKIEQHQNVSNFLNKNPNIKLMLVGENSELYTDSLSIPYTRFNTIDEITHQLEENTCYYIKGSRFYNLDKLVDKYKKEYGIT